MNSEADNLNQPAEAEVRFDELDRADMARLTSGHEAALNELMERHAGKLFNYLIRCLQNEEDAADLAQETFAKVYQSRTRFDPSQKFSTWLYAIASNLVKDRYRRSLEAWAYRRGFRIRSVANRGPLHLVEVRTE